MKITALVFGFLLLVSGSAFGSGATDAATAYFETIKKKDYVAAAEHFDPAALKEFRDELAFLTEMAAKEDESVLASFFGPGASADSVNKMSDAEFFASFLGAIMMQAEAVGGITFDGMEILGEVMEGEDVSHVVTRNRATVGAMEMEAMEVVSFRLVGKEWKALMSGKFKGMAKQIRAAMGFQG